MLRPLVCSIAALAIAACDNATDRFDEMIAESQRVQGQREKDLTLIAAAFDAYIKTHAQFEQRLIALSLCGEEAFLSSHAQDTYGVFWWFMTQQVEQALKDREPVRVRAKETPEQTEMFDKLEEGSVARAWNFLEQEAYYSYFRDAYRQGLFSAYTSMGDAARLGFCGGAEQYKADVVSLISSQLKPKPAKSLN